MCHSQIYSLLAEHYQTPKNILYSALLSVANAEEFSCLPIGKRIAYFEEKNLSGQFAKKLSEAMDKEYDNPFELFQKL